MCIRGSFLLLFCFFVLFSIYSLEITKIEADTFIGSGFNRNFNYYGDISLTGAIELQNIIKFKCGILFGKNSNFYDINLFFNAGYSPFYLPFFRYLGFSVSYKFNLITEYESRLHSILPLLSFNTNRIGLSIGTNFRFFSFFGEKPQLESIISFYFCYYFLLTKMISMNINIGNFNDFYVKNIGSYSLGVNTVININNNWSIINKFELMQSGGDVFSNTFYGISVKLGTRFSW